MNYLPACISIDELRGAGDVFKQKGDRLGFAKYLRSKTIATPERGNCCYACIPLDADIGEGTIIGSSGFGFVKDTDGKWIEMPHVGNVIIGKNVRIGANCCVDRGTIEDTVIGDGTKIDNLVHIAHNCKIGKNVIICAGVTFCGSVTVEDDVWLAPGTVIKEGVTIGKGARTGLGAVVIKDVPPGKLVYGVPAEEHGDA